MSVYSTNVSLLRARKHNTIVSSPSLPFPSLWCLATRNVPNPNLFCSHEPRHMGTCTVCSPEPRTWNIEPRPIEHTHNTLCKYTLYCFLKAQIGENYPLVGTVHRLPYNQPTSTCSIVDATSPCKHSCRRHASFCI